MKKLFKTLLKFVVVLVLLLVVASALVYFIYDEPLPEAKISTEADMYANKMLRALHYKAYRDTQYIEWSFSGGAHQFKWDKQNGTVVVSWSNIIVDLNLTDAPKSRIFIDQRPVSNEGNEALLQKARAFFNNDSFWLVAPFKVFDKGTERSIVTYEDGSRALMVHYTSGGDTPGDTYVWKLGQTGLPISYQMWTGIIPIGGIEVSWDNWQQMQSGVLLPQTHGFGPLTISMGDIKAYN